MNKSGEKQEKALHWFDHGFNCAQSVFAAFAPACGVSVDDALRVATPFGGGIGKQQLVCGAVTGALMALGTRFGKASEDDDERKQHTYALTREFCAEFIRRHGSLQCRELLLGLDMNDPIQNARIKKLGLTESHCNRFVTDAAGMVAEMMNRDLR
ncbi:MAG TPA: C-GCAxxG-C-C family protein [Prolixibacteraceae bacterium]|nr:C-GCAxxG-C-C family protein [Prolixibacteraceae bacterium]